LIKTPKLFFLFSQLVADREIQRSPEKNVLHDGATTPKGHSAPRLFTPIQCHACLHEVSPLNLIL